MHRSAAGAFLGTSAYDGVIFNADPMQIDKISADFPPMWSRHRGSGDRWHAAHSCTPPAPSGDSNSETRGNPSQSVPLSHDFHTRVASPMSASYREIAILNVEYLDSDTELAEQMTSALPRRFRLEIFAVKAEWTDQAQPLGPSCGEAAVDERRGILTEPRTFAAASHTHSLEPKAHLFFGQLAKLWSPPKPEPEGGGGHLVNSNRWHPLA